MGRGQTLAQCWAEDSAFWCGNTSMQAYFSSSECAGIDVPQRNVHFCGVHNLLELNDVFLFLLYGLLCECIIPMDSRCGPALGLP